MPRDRLIFAAYVVLAIWCMATVTIGLFYHYGSDGARFQPWVTPLSLATGLGALLVDRLKKWRQRH